MSKHLDEAERHLTADPPRFDLAVASVLQHLRATASPPPHVEEEKAAGEAEVSDDDFPRMFHESGLRQGDGPLAAFRVGYLMSKASAAREVEREHPVALLTEIDAALAALDLEPPRGLAHDGVLDRATLALLSCRAALFPSAKPIPEKA